ncbi:hypothetical protein LYSHEL_25490 [Lysobacter helvus]|uniref:Helix-turn-helix domain-containing protein n=2 Tax=Lysobacteraceae TaxID=32033 RepID=A0ABN6FX53_9GAMM|nr:hypothetical protein LYSCAS_25490 [Lysobacter caseinilyticus]BCT96678.1 hypothetical protein LYSHEL_25490 [Lysobacter helvus]
MANDTTRRFRKRGRASEHSYLGIPHYILRSQEFGGLDPWALKLLIELAAHYTGKNNGDLSAAFSVLRHRGWRSPGTLNKAIKRLLSERWLLSTRTGGRNRCALYALTWWPVDACKGKWLEVVPEHKASHAWRKTLSVVEIGPEVVTTCSSSAKDVSP